MKIVEEIREFQGVDGADMRSCFKPLLRTPILNQ